MMDKTSPASVSKVPSNQPIGSSSAVSIQTRTINTNKMSSIRAMINSFPIFLNESSFRNICTILESSEELLICSLLKWKYLWSNEKKSKDIFDSDVFYE